MKCNLLTVPPMVQQEPAPGRRVRQTLAAYKGTQVYHSLYLPANWREGVTYPIIVEYTGNYYPPTFSTGKVEDANKGEKSVNYE